MSNTTIQIKYSVTPGNIPQSLSNGEIALNAADGKFYYKNVNGQIVSFAGSGNVYSFATINANNNLITALSNNSILTINPGQNIAITGDIINDVITISANLKPAFDVANAAYNYANTLISGGGSASINVGPTPPVSANNGSLWWDTASGRLYIYYTDVDSSQWVETSPSGGSIDYNSLAANVYSYFGAYSNATNQAFTVANASFGSANSVGTLTNAAFTVANAAFGAANNVAPQVTPAFNTANAAYTVANAAFGFANGVSTNTTAAFAFANGVSTNTTAAFAFANGVSTNTAAAFGSANTVGGYANTAGSLANQAGVIANSAFGSANTAGTQANGAGTIANSAFGAANQAGVLANSAFGSANTAGTQANGAGTIANSAFGSANQAGVIANAAFGAANQAGSVANSVNTYSSSTYLKLTGGTIGGDLSITGNLNITGNTAFVNVTNYKVQDSLIYLADQNYTSDLLEIGFVGNYNNGACSTVHTGLFRAPSNKQYYLFQGYDKEPGGGTGNYIDPTGNNISNAVLVADLITSNLWLGGANSIVWITGSFGAANQAGVIANAAFGFANGVSTNTTAAFSKANNALANTSGVSFNGNLYFPSGNVAIGRSNTTSGYTLDVQGTINAANILVNGAPLTASGGGANVGLTPPASPSVGSLWFSSDLGKLFVYYTDVDSSQWVEASSVGQADFTSTIVSYTGPAYTTANAGYTVANAAFGQGNGSYTVANAAFGHSNTTYTAVNSAFGVINSAFGLANTALQNTNITISGNITSTGVVADSKGDIRNLPINTQSGTYTLVIGDNGKMISTTNNITIPNAVFSPGNVISVFNNSGASNITVSNASSVTMYLGGTTNTMTRSITYYGLATIVCVAANTFFIAGAGVS